jgi:serine protease Do
MATSDENKTAKVSPQKGRTLSFNVPQLPRPRAPKVNRSFAVKLLTVVLIALLAGFSGAWLNERHNTFLSSTASNQKVVTSQSQLINKIAKDVGPSVVSVNVSITSQAPDLGVFSYAIPQQSEQAAGTGIIISSDGLIVTNRHVVPTGTTNVSITLSDGTELKDVKVLGRTNENDSLDVAFLKINDIKGHKLTPATLGKSSAMQVGDNVVAIGNALGQFQNTVTSGIISGYGRSVQAGDSGGSSAENLDDLLQTDAAINEGNSGGPLVNISGQVIGINTAIAGNAQNIGFAIPIDDVSGLIKQVLSSGKLARPYLGVHYIPLTADVASAYDIKQLQGAFVAPAADSASPSVVPDSPAAQAGIQERDIIVAVDGQKVDQNHSLTSLLARHQPGDMVRLSVIRNDKTITVRATLGTVPVQNQ